MPVNPDLGREKGAVKAALLYAAVSRARTATPGGVPTGAEMDMRAAQLGAALGLSGGDRPVASNLERARSAVGKRIRTEIKRIRAAHPALASPRGLTEVASRSYLLHRCVRSA